MPFPDQSMQFAFIKLHIHFTMAPLYQTLYYALLVSKYSSTHYLHDLFKISHLL